MSRRHAIVIAIDGLRASALGAYGSTTAATPALDALAAQSVVFDWMWCDGPLVEDFYRAAWDAQPRMSVSSIAGNNSLRSLFELLEPLGVSSSLTTDDSAIAARAEQLPLREVRRIEVASDIGAESVADTRLAQLFSIAIDQVSAWADSEAAGESASSQLLWLHARGFHGAWDAPLVLRQQLLDEDELQPNDLVTPPNSVRVDDPDELLQFRTAYAAQVMVLDACVEALLGALVECGLDQQTMVVLVGCRGFALGEHGLVGSDVQYLYSEVLHVPCLVRQPGGEAPPPRSARLVQPMDLHGLVRDWFEGEGEAGPAENWLWAPSATAPDPPAFVYSEGAEGEQTLRTLAWMLRRPSWAAADGAAIELYAKPFDRWEANEVAARRPDVVERLLAVLDSVNAMQPPPALDADLSEPPK
jgi:hypothetical protein